ncbi:unnamed protein product [Sphagnum jensenii]|uniref:BHLH domain-containing protein n=1 Tax=Sphagnum jensenii TaxID=128206 RepID=A0ABP0VUD4_9BRYO
MALGPGSEHMDSSTFSSHYSSSLEGGGLISSSSSGSSHGRQQLLLPPAVRGAANLSSVEVAASSHVLSLTAAAGPVQCSRPMEQQQPLWPFIAADQKGGLQRYHSAPSSLLQSLAADCNNEDVLGFSSHQVSSPLGNNTGNIRDDTRGRSLIPPFFSADLFGNQPQLGNDNLLRQSSLPADWLSALQGSIDDTDPSSQMPSMTSPDESLSGRTSEDTAGVGVSGKSSIYSRDDSFLVIDTTSGGLWDSPTSPVLDDLADISVPCQTRAKRGCATHPRSIAERVRRTKISERMKRLQDLVPNMDKQTNMSDMLDEAVEYVKQLQQQVKDLSDTVAQLRDLQAKGLKTEDN